MPAFAARFTRFFLAAVLLAGASAQAQDPSPRQLAPGFSARAADSRLLVLPADMELFSMSAGGGGTARGLDRCGAEELRRRPGPQRKLLGARVTALDAAQADEFAEITTLHRAVAEAISVHHRKALMKLATKQDRLDWSLGDAVRPLKERTGADYALFTWIRDSYASSERKAAMVVMALLGAISLGGEQVGYASLVDLNTGRVVWFNQLNRMSGDLREPEAAVETVESLLKGFPALQQ